MRVHTDWLLTPERAALHLPTATAVLADLHLGYDEVRRRSGEAVPAADVAEAVALLAAVCVRHSVRRLVIAGDLLEDGRLSSPVAGLLEGLRREKVELFAVIPGNHDRGLCAGSGLPLHPDGVELGVWRVVHGDGKLEGECLVHGHFHPCLRWQKVTAPCFLVGPDRIVLPAFSRDARGGNVLTSDCWRGYRCYVPVGNEVMDFGEVSALKRRLRAGISAV
jgi:putative SbcD/Mre11-related phosphoesterase